MVGESVPGQTEAKLKAIFSKLSTIAPVILHLSNIQVKFLAAFLFFIQRFSYIKLVVTVIITSLIIDLLPKMLKKCLKFTLMCLIQPMNKLVSAQENGVKESKLTFQSSLPRF